MAVLDDNPLDGVLWMTILWMAIQWVHNTLDEVQSFNSAKTDFALGLLLRICDGVKMAIIRKIILAKFG